MRVNYFWAHLFFLLGSLGNLVLNIGGSSTTSVSLDTWNLAYLGRFSNYLFSYDLAVSLLFVILALFSLGGWVQERDGKKNQFSWDSGFWAEV